MGNSTSNAAIVDKVRSLYEGREAVYTEKGALRVRVNAVRIKIEVANATNDVFDYLAFDLEEVPTPGLPVWLEGYPSIGPHPHRWTVGTGFRTRLFPHYISAYCGWSMHFSPKLVAEIVEMATNFAGDDSQELYRNIRRHIDDETIKRLEVRLAKRLFLGSRTTP